MGSLMESITSEVVHQPPRILIYGLPGVGKSTLGSTVQNGIFMDLENGIPGRAIPRFTGMTDYNAVMLAMKELLVDDHSYKELVIDSLSRLELLGHSQISTQEGVESIGLIPFGKGYAQADSIFEDFRKTCDTLREQRGMPIIVVAHAEAVTVDDPMTGPFTRMQPQMHKRSLAKFIEWFDLIGYMSVDRIIDKKSSGNREIITSKTTGARVLITEDDGSALAKCRWTLHDEEGKETSRLIIPKEDGYAVIRKALGDAMKFTAAEDKQRRSTTKKAKAKKTEEVEF